MPWHYPVAIPAAAADPNSPFPEACFDLAIFNASFHYSSDYRRTLAEIRRCLRPSGRVVIMDTPVYQRREHGEMMRAERRTHFERVYGFPSDALKSVEYLDFPMLQALAKDVGIDWKYGEAWYGLNWALRPWKAKLLGKRPPSKFMILVGRFKKQ